MVLCNLIELLEVYLPQSILHFVGFVRVLRQGAWDCLRRQCRYLLCCQFVQFLCGEGVRMGEVGNTRGQDCFGKGCF